MRNRLPARAPALPRAVLALGAASLLTDLSSEMIYPLLPVFLAGLGAGAVVLGVMEGGAETIASVLKLVSGAWSDRVERKKPLILLGYGLSGVVRPLIGLATSWWMVVVPRLLDRVGKGIRTSPRDALIADVTPPERRGAAYGVHRAMDHAGAVAGPLVAAALLGWGGLQVGEVFLLAAIPAALVIVVLIAFVKEDPRDVEAHRPEARGRLRDLGADFRRLLLALGVFTLGNSTDAFLLLRVRDAGLPVAWIAVLWSAHHVVKMVATYWGGRLSDRFGRRSMVLAAWTIYALAYAGFGWLDSPAALAAVFLGYGLYFGLEEPSERAWVGDLVPARLRGTAFGFYHMAIGLGALPASLLFGAVWDLAGPRAAFSLGAGLAALGALLLLRVRSSQ